MTSKPFDGFKVIRISFSADSRSQHHLFVKEHSVRNQTDDTPVGRTLFVVGVPPYATLDSMKRVFSCVGSVQNVIFQAKPNATEKEKKEPPKGFKVAYIIYQKSLSVQKALELKELAPLSTKDHPIITGMQKWAMQYNAEIKDHNKLEEEVQIFMTKYDKEEKMQKERKKQQDDEGWTVVTKKGRNPGLSRKESVANKLKEKAVQGEKRKYLDDFYTFQKREQKKKQLDDMRRRYEEDKKKVEAMKLARKFKPF